MEPDRAALLERLTRTLLPVVLAADELEALAARSIEEVEGGWRLRWDRRALATERVEPFAFLPAVRCDARVIAGAESQVMPPDAARRFAAALPDGTLDLVDGAGHHVELEAPERVASAIVELVSRARR